MSNHKVRSRRWWPVPIWAKTKHLSINARVEEVDTKNSFRDVFKSKRRRIPADGCYELAISPANGKKDPWFISA